jgi:DHA1 family bicyclomycin/chloramphenicol resistance-like MFS transporter
MNDFPRAAGSASALLGVLQFAIGGVVAPLVGVRGSHDALPMAIIMASMGLLAVSARLLLGRRPPAPGRSPSIVVAPGSSAR